MRTKRGTRRGAARSWLTTAVHMGETRVVGTAETREFLAAPGDVARTGQVASANRLLLLLSFQEARAAQIAAVYPSEGAEYMAP